jgi:hypothetical protein
MPNQPKDRKYFDDLIELSKKNETFNKRTLQALNWHKQNVIQKFGDRNVTPDAFFDKKNYPNFPLPGNIVTFRYDPISKNELPFYDVFPLVLVLRLVPGGFLGLNFHYLHPLDRAIFMSGLKRYEKPMEKGIVRINIRYNMLENMPGLPFYKECIKVYKKGKIKSMFYTLTPEEWDIALFLPTQKFMKAQKQKIWNESRQRLRKQGNK